MATRPAASSPTDGPEPQDPVSETLSGTPEAPGPAASPPTSAHDAERRAFFFQFGKQAVTAVGQAAGMADIVGRTSSSVAASLLGLGQSAPTPVRREFTRSEHRPVVSPSRTPAAEDSFRSAYRLAETELLLLDQRGVPERLDEVVAKRGSDVAYYLRLGVARGGPLMAQVAAYGLALTAVERAAQPATQRNVELRRTQRALVEARPSSRLPGWAMQRMNSVLEGLGDDADGADVGAALRDAADAIAHGLQSAHAAISAALAQTLPRHPDRPLSVLVHGDQGALHGGLVGTGLAALRHVRDEGGALRVFVTEGRPFMDGARLASWELRQAGIEHKVIADSAVAWLLAREPIDAVLVAAEWIAANGDVGAVIGSRAIAQQVALAERDSAGARPRLIVSGSSMSIDLDTADGAAIPGELRPARDLSAYLAAVPIRATDALVPAADIIPATLVETLVTEHGVTATPMPDSVAALAGVSREAE